MNVVGINAINQKRNQQTFGMKIKYEGDGKEFLVQAVEDVFQIKPGQPPLVIEQIAQRAKIFSDNLKLIVDSTWQLSIGHNLSDSIVFRAETASEGYKSSQFPFSNKENLIESLEEFLNQVIYPNEEIPQPHVKTVLDAIG